ncbi:MAG: amino acid adenylation domain-containing protein, partial [Acidobacteria bacterium]|nr:amino acid adenylation domain-containing protein [Acidobacteriota bacterium]
YNTDLFDQPTVERMVKHYERLLEAIAADATQPISQISLLTSDERMQILEGWSGHPSLSSPNSSLPSLFEAQAAQTPDAVAVVCHNESLTYAELNSRATQLSRHLRGLGLTPETVVGICVERSVEMLVGLLGILKAGGAYLPLDPDSPPERLAFMLRDARAGILLTQEDMLSRLPEHDARVVLLDTHRHHFDQESTENLPPAAHDENHAYLIYTSGSTGTPKGVKIKRSSLINYIRWAKDAYSQGESLDFALYSSLAFDLTVTSIFTPLITGSRVVIYPSKNHINALEQIFTDNQVNVLKLTPSHLALVKNRDNRNCRIKRLIVGGEALETNLAQKVFESFGGAVEIFNEYGPTEATVGCMIYRFDPERDSRAFVPIGRPAANTQVYILDERLQPVAENCVGELYIGGSGLADGYLNRPELSGEKFLPHPFSSIAGAKLYRTGDIARYLLNGDVEFLGRRDNQVKVRGFRIELGEIEAALAQHPVVRAAVVVVRETVPGDRRLTAYFVARNTLSVTAGELRAFLKERLPSYMLPSAYVPVDALPLTPNGKLDKRALPEPDEMRPELAQKYVAPETPLEKSVARIWSEVLGVERVGIHDNFFDLGGHSLLIVQVNDILQKMLDRQTSIIDMFKYPTIKALCEYLSAGESGQDFTDYGPEIYEARRSAMRRRRQQRHNRSHT